MAGARRLLALRRGRQLASAKQRQPWTSFGFSSQGHHRSCTCTHTHTHTHTYASITHLPFIPVQRVISVYLSVILSLTPLPLPSSSRQMLRVRGPGGMARVEVSPSASVEELLALVRHTLCLQVLFSLFLCRCCVSPLQPLFAWRILISLNNPHHSLCVCVCVCVSVCLCVTSTRKQRLFLSLSPLSLSFPLFRNALRCAPHAEVLVASGSASSRQSPASLLLYVLSREKDEEGLADVALVVCSLSFFLSLFDSHTHTLPLPIPTAHTHST